VAATRKRAGGTVKLVFHRVCKMYLSIRFDKYIHKLIILSYKQINTHQFSGLFSRTTWVSRYQKGKTGPDLNETRDDGVLG